MSKVHLACGAPFCQSPQGTQTNLSIGLRITALALGTLIALVGVLTLLNVPVLSQLGTTVGWTLFSIGICLALVSASIKCIKSDDDPAQETPSSMMVAKQPHRLDPSAFHLMMPTSPSDTPDTCQTQQREAQAPDGSMIRQHRQRSLWVGQDECHIEEQAAQEAYDASLGESSQKMTDRRGFVNTEIAMCEEETFERKKWDGSQGIEGAGASYHYRGQIQPSNRSYLDRCKSFISDAVNGSQNN